MAKQIWFGIPATRMQWVPAPLAGAQASLNGFVDLMAFENGGADVQRSNAYRKQFDFEFNAPIKGSDGLEVFNKFASGFYGDGLIYFADPYAFETNLFPAHWASPALIEQGWPEVSSNTAFFTATASNSYQQPPHTAQWSTLALTSTPSTVPSRSAIIPIPTGYTLHFGWSGSVTSTGRVYYRTISSTGTYGTATAITALSATSSTRMNVSVASTSAVAVQFYIGSTDSNPGQVDITSMLAQLWPTGVTPTLTGEHVPGDGHTGLMFADDARVETYTYISPPRKALSTTLLEVGAWRKV